MSAGSLIVPWSTTAANRQVRIPSAIPVGATIGMQNLALGTRGASLSNYFELRLR